MDHGGRIGRQIQVDVRCAALGSILKALVMSTMAENIQHAAETALAERQSHASV